MILIDDLVKAHGGVVAVDEVTLRLDGGVTAIVGPNGAGKSTLLAAIGRLVGIDAGVVSVDGLDVATTRSRDIARRLAILRQDNHLSIRLSVEDLVGYGRFPHGGSGRTPEDLARIDDAITLLDLQEMRGRYVDELSGGQRQRAFVAMAIAQSTTHLLLDEPLNNLDPRHAVALMKLLRRLADERAMTIVLVVHDVNVAAHYADVVVAMREGRVEHCGAVGEVITEQNLTALYSTPARVVPVGTRTVVLWE